MVRPHEFGFIQDEEDWDEDDTFDLSGWMSRSPPDNGFGNAHYEEPPMLEEEPMVRPRERPRSNVHSSAQFTPPMQGISGTNQFVTKESPFNPFWVDDAGLAPKLTGGTKLVGFAGLLTGLTFYAVGRNAHNRAANQVNETLEFAAPISKKLAVAGLMGYLHPVLGWNHGAMKKLEGSWWGAGKVALHTGLIVGGVFLLRRV